MWHIALLIGILGGLVGCLLDVDHLWANRARIKNWRFLHVPLGGISLVVLFCIGTFVCGLYLAEEVLTHYK